MKSYVKVLFLLGLVALMMPLLLGYAIGPIGASHTNTIGDHADSKSLDNGTCNGCHDRLARNESTDVNNLSAHRRHFATAFLNFASDGSGTGCAACHEETVYGSNAWPTLDSGNGDGLGSDIEGDLSYNDTDSANNNADFARVARKQVKPDVCESCHGAFDADSVGHGGNDYVTDDPRGCAVDCHVPGGGGSAGDPDSAHSSADYINTRYASSSVFCVRCHGELAWYQTNEGLVELP